MNVSSLLASSPLWSTGRLVEIGTAWGGLALHLLDTLPKLRVTAVDPFLGGYDRGDLMSNFLGKLQARHGLSAEQVSSRRAAAMAHELHTAHGCRYRLRNAKSTDAAPSVANGSVAVLFIDGARVPRTARPRVPAAARRRRAAPRARGSSRRCGAPMRRAHAPRHPRAGDHTLHGVLADIAAWLPKVAPGGLVLFNDFGGPFRHKYGVRAAVWRSFGGGSAAVGPGAKWAVFQSGAGETNAYVTVPESGNGFME